MSKRAGLNKLDSCDGPGDILECAHAEEAVFRGMIRFVCTPISTVVTPDIPATRWCLGPNRPSSFDSNLLSNTPGFDGLRGMG